VARKLVVCVLASGSSGNATLVSDGETHLLVDCGLVAKEIDRRLGLIGFHPSQLSGILLTHAHIDHYRSAGTIHARHRVPVYVDPEADRAIRRRGDNGSYWRVGPIRPVPRSIGAITVREFANSHSVNGGVPSGFVLSAAGARVGVITDTGHATPQAVAALRGCEVIVAEANYEAEIVRGKLRDSAFSADWGYLSWVDSGEGHLSNAQCAELLAEIVTIDTRHVFLAHMSENHEDGTRDNNSFENARQAVMHFFQQAGLRLPDLHRTYRRGATEGQASTLVTIG